MSTIVGTPDQLDQVVNRDDTEELRALEGLQEVMLLVDRDSGKVVTLSFWESREHLDRSAERAKQLRAEISRQAGASAEPRVEVFEVASREQFGSRGTESAQERRAA